MGKRRFTLIELIIVVAIMMILCSLLLPALGNARQMARTGVCLSNQRQIGQAVMMYTDDNGGYLPQVGYLGRYVVDLQPYLPLKNSSVYIAGISSYAATANLNQVYFCPNTLTPANLSPCWTIGKAVAPLYLTNYIPTSRYSSTVLNNLGGWCVVYSDIVSESRRVDTLKSGSALLSEQDYYNANGTITYCASWMLGGAYTANYPSQSKYTAIAWNHHRRAANALFLDGHVRTYKHTGATVFNDDWIPSN